MLSWNVNENVYTYGDNYRFSVNNGSHKFISYQKYAHGCAENIFPASTV